MELANRPLTWTKDMVAWPSVSGINAALLAESGFLGPRTILEGDRGFWRMQASDRFDPAMLLEGLGTKFNMRRLYFKAYPTCRWNQAAPMPCCRSWLAAAGASAMSPLSRSGRARTRRPAVRGLCAAQPRRCAIQPAVCNLRSS